MFTKTLLPDTFRTLKLVSGIPEIQRAYLAGDTALSLQVGHRISVDLDFFTPEEFNETHLAETLESEKNFVSQGTTKGTVWGIIGETKFSIFSYKYPLISSLETFEDVNLASTADIAAMKIHAIEDRGTRRDFVDIYFLAKKYTLSQMLTFYQQKYHVLSDHIYSILRSLDYFEDAEQETIMPNMLIPIHWEEVKEYFRQETKKLALEKFSL